MPHDPPTDPDGRAPAAAHAAVEALTRQVAELRRRLEEAEETIRAIREDEVDAFVVSRGEADRVLTLESADRPYRVLVESMQQGALTLSADGTILYSNPRFAALLGRPQDGLAGLALLDLVPEGQRTACASLLREGRVTGAQGEARLRQGRRHDRAGAPGRQPPARRGVGGALRPRDRPDRAQELRAAPARPGGPARERGAAPAGAPRRRGLARSRDRGRPHHGLGRRVSRVFGFGPSDPRELRAVAVGHCTPTTPAGPRPWPATAWSGGVTDADPGRPPAAATCGASTS